MVLWTVVSSVALMASVLASAMDLLMADKKVASKAKMWVGLMVASMVEMLVVMMVVLRAETMAA